MTRSTPSELLVRQRLTALGRSLTPARNGDVNGVHHARVATRRLREALPVVVSAKTARKLKKRMRRLTRALGPVRELDVALLTLDELAASGDVPEGGITRLREVIGDERSRLRVEMMRQIDRLDLHRV